MPTVASDAIAQNESTSSDVDGLLAELTELTKKILDAPVQHGSWVEQVDEAFRASAKNLLAYLALRRHDLRPMQQRLAAQGLSSLGRAESHVAAAVGQVLIALQHLCGKVGVQPSRDGEPIGIAVGQQQLAEHAEALLGPVNPERGVRIMVTMPSEAANDYGLVHDLLSQGMDCMRINCAHDDALAWARMIEHLRRAERTLGRSCRIAMDLAGPKLRTGPMEPGATVAKIRPKRDEFGRVTAPARVWLTAEESPQPPPFGATACLRVPRQWLARLQKSDCVKFRDARGAKRRLVVLEVRDEGCWTELTQSAYVIPETVLRIPGKDDSDQDCVTRVGGLPARETALYLNPGDLLILTRDQQPGQPAIRDGAGQVLSPARISCTLPEVFDDVHAGESIWFDDGKIGGIVESIGSTQVFVRITHARVGGERLRPHKGINLPESHLHLAALTPKDIEDLEFVAHHADIVELSFANSAQDVEMLQQQWARLVDRKPAIVLKIETRRGFANLPAMLLTAMRMPRCGVMIARGDLAVECGFERLAEVQEEILWICEAAHVPVIWATQVLETLAKEGQPSRAEITDAAMGHRAECVMLNKGPHMLNAVRMLDDILRRMQSHQAKKTPMLRELRLAHGLSAIS